MQHGRKSHDKIGGKVLLLDLILNFVCLFVRLLFGCFFNRFLFLSYFSFIYFVIICPVPGCSGMFRNVPGCSEMFHVPGFVNAPPPPKYFTCLMCTNNIKLLHVSHAQ